MSYQRTDEDEAKARKHWLTLRAASLEAQLKANGETVNAPQLQNGNENLLEAISVLESHVDDLEARVAANKTARTLVGGGNAQAKPAPTGTALQRVLAARGVSSVAELNAKYGRGPLPLPALKGYTKKVADAVGAKTLAELNQRGTKNHLTGD